VAVVGESDLQSLLSNMNQQQLMQLLGNDIFNCRLISQSNTIVESYIYVLAAETLH